MRIHPSDLVLEDLLLSLRAEQRTLLRHVSSCSSCRSRLATLPIAHRAMGISESNLETARDRRGEAGFTADLTSEIDYGPAIERSERKYIERSRVIERQRAEAPQLVAELLEHTDERRVLLLANTTRFHTWGVYELLVDRSWESRFRSSTESESLATLALTLSDHLDASYYTVELIEDLRARAWCYVANALRIRSDLQGAERAFQTAYSHLRKGTREPVERATFLWLKGGLRRAQRRFDDSLPLLRRASTIFLSQGDNQRAGASMITLALALQYGGYPERAIPVLYRCLELIDQQQDARLVITVCHNLIDNLVEMDRYMEAQGIYRKVRSLYKAFPEPSLQNRRMWVKGKIARGLGQEGEAESLFLQAREGFLKEEIPYETALVSLELATLYAEQGRTAELKRLAEEMLPIFTSRQIHREALAALAFLKQAVEAEKVSFDVVTRVATFLRKAQNDPGLKFEEPAES